MSDHRKTWKDLGNGSLEDRARVEMTILGPVWSPLVRYRIYYDHKPEDHMTVWYVYWFSKWFGTYTPPGWFLRLIGQAERPKKPDPHRELWDILDAEREERERQK